MCVQSGRGGTGEGRLYSNDEFRISNDEFRISNDEFSYEAADQGPSEEDIRG